MPRWVWLVWRVLPCKRGRTVTHQEVMDMPEGQHEVVIYWRPGCGYSARLRAALDVEGERAHWVDIWQDDEAAAYVRSVNDGNEVVPTVVIDGTPHTNPDAAVVRQRFTAS